MADCCLNNMMLCVASPPQTIRGRENQIYLNIRKKRNLIGYGKPSIIDCYIRLPPPNKFDDFFVISGGMVCQYQRANPPHHLTTSLNSPDPAATESQ